MNPIDFLVHNMMLPILKSSYSFTGNYGWAIILLTIIIRMILLPLTMQSYYSMKEMQKLQPKLKKIQERYKGKPEELNKRMIELYKTHKVNPLGGCLPMVVQMPFLFALYASLIGTDFKKMLLEPGVSHSFLVFPDLTRLGFQHQGTFFYENIILLALFTLSTVIQQRTMTPPVSPDMDPRQAAMQKQMQIMMPIMITSMFLIIPLPTGIFIYLVVSNLIGIAQYAFLNAQSKRKDAREAAGIGKNVSSKIESEDEEDEKEVVTVSAKESVKTSTKNDDTGSKGRSQKGGKKKKKRK